MRDPKLASKSFNPYDLGSVAKITKEFRSSGYIRVSHSEPYIPPRLKQGDTPAEGSRNHQTEGAQRKRS